jgi:ABC-type sugar transport system ATPase subunit
LKAGGTTILYVSHRLPEVFRLCDRITVLRDGSFVDTVTAASVTTSDIVKAMVGRELPQRSDERSRNRSSERSDVRLSIHQLSRSPHFANVSLKVDSGEVVGIFGLVGSGRSALLETLFGLHQPDQGYLQLDGARVTFRSPRDAARAGIALVPEERHRQALLFNLDLRNNLVIPQATLTANLLIDAGRERLDAARMLANWRIKAAGIDALPDSLSGGNQQKVVVAKWLATRPRVLLLDEPTKGVDVGAKFEIHEMIRQQAREGLAVLVVSSDLPEILGLADRILVMKEGEVQGEIPAATATEENVMHLATHALARRGFGEGGVTA